MARWEIMSREYHSPKWDLLTVRIWYRRPIENQYLILKDEKRVPRNLLRERKWGRSRALDGKPWREADAPKRWA